RPETRRLRPVAGRCPQHRARGSGARRGNGRGRSPARPPALHLVGDRRPHARPLPPPPRSRGRGASRSRLKTRGEPEHGGNLTVPPVSPPPPRRPWPMLSQRSRRLVLPVP